jgi:rhamnulokinase
VNDRQRVLAVDLGATSIRVAAVDLDTDRPAVEVLHRWRHAPVSDADGALRWHWDRIIAEVEHGLHLGVESGPVSSIGVDGWGVDYGYLDHSGELVDPPYAYRDARTKGWEETVGLVGTDELYRITGVQLMEINTIFQIAADTDERLARADKLMMLPDLLTHHLTGWVGVERSNLSTTGLMDAHTGDWSDALIEAVGVPRSLFPEPANAGTLVGEWNGIPVHLVGSHDTASAFLGAPSTGVGTVFVSTGSWVIVGVERDQPDNSEAARDANFSNEVGALGGIRFLKNVVGFWILEQCRQAWGNPPIENLIAEAEGVLSAVPIFDASDRRFVSPEDMLAEVVAASGLSPDSPRAVMARSIIESIVEGVVTVVSEIETAAGIKAGSLALVGGGARIPLVARLLEKRSGLDVVVGSPEATALGSAVVQGIALGRFDNLDEARRWLTPSGAGVEVRGG